MEPDGVAAELGLGPGDRLGAGGEAVVYALDANRVARVHRAGFREELVALRCELLAELGRSRARVEFAIPEVLEVRRVAGARVTIERRLPGASLESLLGAARGAPRERLIERYLEAALALRALAVPRPWFGELMAVEPLRTATFREFLETRAAACLARAGPDFAGVDAAALARALPEPARPGLVHLDVFPSNVLAQGERITAVLDFGPLALVGDPDLDPVTAVVYLEPVFSPNATDADRALAAEWLAQHDLGRLHEPARRWLAAFWSAAVRDPRLHGWGREVLLGA